MKFILGVMSGIFFALFVENISPTEGIEKVTIVLSGFVVCIVLAILLDKYI